MSEKIVATATQMPGAAPLRVMFQDEARFGCISEVRRCWCPKPLRPLVQPILTQEHTYAYAAVSPLDGRLDSLILAHVNGRCMQLFIEEMVARYPNERVVMVLDDAGWHRSQDICLPTTWVCCRRPRTRPSSIPSNISGTTCARNTSSIRPVIRWKHSKANWRQPWSTTKANPLRCTPSLLGTGS